MQRVAQGIASRRPSGMGAPQLTHLPYVSFWIRPSAASMAMRSRSSCSSSVLPISRSTVSVAVSAMCWSALPDTSSPVSSSREPEFSRWRLSRAAVTASRRSSSSPRKCPTSMSLTPTVSARPRTARSRSPRRPCRGSRGPRRAGHPPAERGAFPRVAARRRRSHVPARPPQRPGASMLHRAGPRSPGSSPPGRREVVDVSHPLPRG